MLLGITLIAVNQYKSHKTVKGKLEALCANWQAHEQKIDDLYVRSELTVEQQEFKAALELKWKTAMEQQRAEFAVKLAEEYKKATESIAFSTVEYKKTITKKRKETSRKTKATTPQKQHRSIDDE